MTGKSPVLPFFAAAELILYIAFLYCDFTGAFLVGTALKYVSLLLCLLFSLDSRKEKDGRIVCFALLFTAFADLFLLVLNRWYAVGVAVFCPVQVLYAFRLRRLGARPIPLPLRAAVSLGVFLAVLFLRALDPVTALVCFYFPQLLCNAAESLTLFGTRKTRLFSLGLILFVCCDVCVGLNNLSAYLPVRGTVLFSFVSVAMWAFYLPSQVLIVLSASKRVKI